MSGDTASKGGCTLSITEQERAQLRWEVSQLMGEDTADILMRQLPPTGWGDIATKADLEILGDGVRTEMTNEFVKVRAEMAVEFANVRAEMATEFANVRAEMATEFAKVRAEMATEFAKVRAEMATEFAKVRAEMDVMKTELKLYFEEAIHRQTRSMFRQVFAANALFITMILAAAQIF